MEVVYASKPSTWEAEAGGISEASLVYRASLRTARATQWDKNFENDYLACGPNHSRQCCVLIAAGSPACGESGVQYMPGSKMLLQSTFESLSLQQGTVREQ